MDGAVGDIASHPSHEGARDGYLIMGTVVRLACVGVRSSIRSIPHPVAIKPRRGWGTRDFMR
jgi:hypothetical protein